MIIRFIAKLCLKVLLIPVWFLLFAVGLAVSLVVNIYVFWRSVVVFVLSFLLIGVIVFYQDWVQAAVLMVLYIILIAVLFIGTAVEVILEQIQGKVADFIFS